MKLAICAVTLLLLFLIRFVNHYMLRRKQREFAIQSVMGIHRSINNTAVLFIPLPTSLSRAPGTALGAQ